MVPEAKRVRCRSVATCCNDARALHYSVLADEQPTLFVRLASRKQCGQFGSPEHSGSELYGLKAAVCE